MLNNLLMMACVAVVGAVGAISSNATWQEEQKDDVDVIIVNQDGEQVEAGNLKAKVRVMGQANGQKNRFKIQGDKIIIENEEGEKQEIDISGARSVSVQQSVRSVDKDGEQTSETRAKAIIIGPDGEKRIIELGPVDGGGMGFVPPIAPGAAIQGFEALSMPEIPRMMFRRGFPGSFQAAPSSKFIIGVHCEPAGEALKFQLNLDSGLVVKHVNEGSPADNKIDKHDILVFANQKPLSSLGDLTKVVDDAGEAERSISVIAVRRGKEVEFEVSPVERPANQQMQHGLNFRAPDFDLQFRELGPGVIMEDMPAMEDLPAGFPEQMKRMQEQLDEMNKMMNQLQNDG